MRTTLRILLAVLLPWTQLPSAALADTQPQREDPLQLTPEQKAYCDRVRRAGGGHPGGAAGAFDQARMVAANLERTAGNPRGSWEASRSRSGDLTVDGRTFSGDPRMRALCAAYYANLGPGQPGYDSRVGDVPLPEGQVIASDTEGQAKANKLKNTAIVGAAGAVGFGLLGLLFAGPFGLLVGAALGGLFMGGLAFAGVPFKFSKPKPKSKAGAEESEGKLVTGDGPDWTP